MEGTLDISWLTAEQQQHLREQYFEYKHVDAQQGQGVLRRAGVAYLDPTFDKTFKWLTGSDNPDIARTISKSLMFLADKSLATRGIRSIRSLSAETDKRSEQLSKLPGSSSALLMMDVPVELDLFDNLYEFNQRIIEEIGSILNRKNLSKAAIIKDLGDFKSSLGKRIYDVLPQTRKEALPKDQTSRFLESFSDQLNQLKNGDAGHDSQIDNIQARLNNLVEIIDPINAMHMIIGRDNQWLHDQLSKVLVPFVDTILWHVNNPKIALKDIQAWWEGEKPNLYAQTNANVLRFINAVRANVGRNLPLVSQCCQMWAALEDALFNIEISEEVANSIKELKKYYDNALVIDEALRAIAITDIPRVLDKNAILGQLQPYKDRMIAGVQGYIDEISEKEIDQITKDKLIQIFQQWQKHITSSSMSIADFQEILRRFNGIIVDIEMQKKKDNIEARILQYGANLLLIKEAKDLLPLVLISICGWSNPEVIHDVLGSILDGETNGAVPIFQKTIYLQTASSPIGKDDGQRKNERKRVKDIFKTSLRQRYPELIKDGESFKNLWIQREGDDVQIWIEKQNLRTAYEVLCFLRLAPLTPQLGGERGDKDPNPDNTKPLNDYQLRTRIFNPIIRKAYDLMNTNDVRTPGAQEQYLGVWSEQTRIDELQQRLNEQQQNAITDLINSASLLQFAPQKIVVQWARNTFLSPRNLGIRQATIDQIERRRENFGDNIVAILREEYNQAIAASGVPPTPIRSFEQPREDLSGFVTSSSKSDEKTPSPTTSRGGSPERPLGKALERPPVPSLPDHEIKALADKVASYLCKCTKDFKVHDAADYIRKEGLPLNENLRTVVAKLREDSKYEDIPRERIGVFSQGVSRAIKPLKG
ncbi:MAG: hypothetical protein LBC30_00610 [Puniceicoccales bacterium]|jgi:hypothetical protein|nr:hypothetical protein [Puniceicoccales bacterium]